MEVLRYASFQNPSGSIPWERAQTNAPKYLQCAFAVRRYGLGLFEQMGPKKSNVFER